MEKSPLQRVNTHSKSPNSHLSSGNDLCIGLPLLMRFVKSCSSSKNLFLRLSGEPFQYQGVLFYPLLPPFVRPCRLNDCCNGNNRKSAMQSCEVMEFICEFENPCI